MYCVYMHVCMYTCVCVYVCACMYVCMYVCMYACVRACMRACMHACVRACVRAIKLFSIKFLIDQPLIFLVSWPYWLLCFYGTAQLRSALLIRCF